MDSKVEAFFFFVVGAGVADIIRERWGGPVEALKGVSFLVENAIGCVGCSCHAIISRLFFMGVVRFWCLDWGNLRFRLL